MGKLIAVGLLTISPLLSADEPSCAFNRQARELIQAIQQDPLQRRSVLTCNPMLSDIAQRKAQALADAGHISHMVGGNPNTLLRNAGYPLPKYYGFGIANQVEAIAGGQGSVQQVWKEFKQSDGHRPHLLGEHPFYLEQHEIGAGYVYQWESPHVDYWVVYVTKNTERSDQAYDIKNGVLDKGVVSDTVTIHNKKRAK